MVSCEFGHFWVDLRRGQVFKVDSNGRNLTEVTPGLRNWFKEHLQMKIICSRIYNADTDAELSYYDIDNKFFGIGLSMGWDNRFKRVLITKRDYIPVGNPKRVPIQGRPVLQERAGGGAFGHQPFHGCLLYRWI